MRLEPNSLPWRVMLHASSLMPGQSSPARHERLHGRARYVAGAPMEAPFADTVKHHISQDACRVDGHTCHDAGAQAQWLDADGYAPPEPCLLLLDFDGTIQ